MGKEPSGQLPPAFSVAVFGRDEAASIGACLAHVLAAAGAARLCIDVMLNGTTDGSADAARQVLSRTPAAQARIWRIRHADKSNAINQFIALRPPADSYIFVDAYARVHPQSLRALAAALAAHPQANAAAALPSTGRSAPAIRAGMAASPVVQGSLFALRPAFLERLAAAGLRLPVNLYRGDGLLSSMLMHDLDATERPWDTSHVVVVPEATWEITPLSPWSPADIRRQARRQLRQRRGRFESAAIKTLIYGAGGGYHRLPANADRMLCDWAAQDPGRRPRPWRDPLGALALRQAAAAAAPSEVDLAPILA